MALVVGEKATPFVTVPEEAVHVKVLAPLPLTTTVLPTHTAELVVLAVMVGSAFTSKLIVADEALRQPAALVPVIE